MLGRPFSNLLGNMIGNILDGKIHRHPEPPQQIHFESIIEPSEKKRKNGILEKWNTGKMEGWKKEKGKNGRKKKEINKSQSQFFNLLLRGF
jgi:hypothetical protein